MLRFLLFACLVLLSAGRAVAQDWATVRVGDTAWFFGGTKLQNFGTPSCYWGGAAQLLRVQLVDSAKQAGSDSVYFFPHGLRGRWNGGCLDTAAASWLGYRVVRKASGDEYYFNSVADTITIKTRAQVGDSWQLSRDTSGRVFRATLTAVNVDTVDGTPDSVKTASIQAYQGNTPIIHPYNARVLRWSKYKGWESVLDFFAFPNYPLPDVSGGSMPTIIGSPSDSGQKSRLPWGSIRPHILKADLLRKYQPGNEWIWQKTFASVLNTAPLNCTYTHDSVMAFQLLDSTRGKATIRRAVATRNNGCHTTVAVSVQTVSDTVYANFSTSQTFEHTPLPEVKAAGSNVGVPGGQPYVIAAQLIRPRYGIEPWCKEYIITQATGNQGYFIQSGGCWVYTPSTDMRMVCETILTGFGLLESNKNSFQTGYLDLSHMPYLKLGSCEMGAKINVSSWTVGIAAVESLPSMTLSPNPATDRVRVAGLPVATNQIILKDCYGRIYYTIGSSAKEVDLPTASLPAGVYFVEVSNSTGRTTLKLQVMH